MASYIAMIHKEAGSDYGVSFVDFPGCVTAAVDLDEAAAAAREALTGHIEAMREAGEAVPTASALEDVRSHELAAGAVAFLVVDVASESRSVRVSITVPEDDLRAIDAYARERGMPRSSFLVRSARRMMAEDRDARP